MFTTLFNLLKKRKSLIESAYELQKVEFRNEHPHYVYSLLVDGKI